MLNDEAEIDFIDDIDTQLNNLGNTVPANILSNARIVGRLIARYMRPLSPEVIPLVIDDSSIMFTLFSLKNGREVDIIINNEQNIDVIFSTVERDRLEKLHMNKIKSVMKWLNSESMF